MTDADLLELRNPPDVIRHYPRFTDALRRGVAALEMQRDGLLKLREERDLYKSQVGLVLKAAGADDVGGVVRKLNGGDDGQDDMQ